MKYANEILLVCTLLTTAITSTASEKTSGGKQVPNNQNAFVTPKPTLTSKNSNETDNEGKYLQSIAARIAEFTDRSFKHTDDTSLKNLKEQKAKHEHTFRNTKDNKNPSSLITDFNAEDESQKQATETKNEDSLETSPSEDVRARKLEPSSPPGNVQDIKEKMDVGAEHQELTSTNETRDETRLLGIWKLPPEFIGFAIEDGESANVAKPAAVVESRSFITKPEVSRVQLNFVVPQAKVAQESRGKSSTVKNNQRRQHGDDDSQSSAEHSGEGPSSDVYTETDGDLGKFLDEDYKAQIEKEAEAMIKNNKEESDSSEDNKQPPSTHKHHETAYSNNHNPSPPFRQNGNNNHKPSPPFRQNGNNNHNPSPPSHQNGNNNHKPSPPFRQNDNNNHENSKRPQTYSQQKFMHHDRNKPPQRHPQSGSRHNEANKSPEPYSRQKINFPGGSFFFYKGMDGMLYDPSLFPGLFDSTQTRNSPKTNSDYIQNMPPSSEIYNSPDYAAHPFYLEDGYPIDYSNVGPGSSPNFDERPKLLLVHPIPAPPAINENRPRNLRPIAIQGNHQYAQTGSGENLRQPPPVYRKHYQEALKANDEHYRELPPASYEQSERDSPVHDEYREYQTNGNRHHSTNPHHQKQPHFREHVPHQYDYDSSEEDADCSSEEKDFDETSDLDEDNLPAAPVPQAKLNINNPIPVSDPDRPHENDNLHSYSGNRENPNEYLPQQPNDSLHPFNGNPDNHNGYLPQHSDDNLHPLNGNPENHNMHLPQEPDYNLHSFNSNQENHNAYVPQQGDDNLHPFNENPGNPDGYVPQQPNDNLHPFNGNPGNPNGYVPQQPNDNLHPFNDNPGNPNGYFPQQPNDNLHPFNDNPGNPNGYVPQQADDNLHPFTGSPGNPNGYVPQQPDDNLHPIIDNPKNRNRYLPKEPISEEENINPPIIPTNHPGYSYDRQTKPAVPTFNQKKNPEAFQYERKHKYRVAMYEHDESIYQSNVPKVASYDPGSKTSSEEYAPASPEHSAEEPQINPHDQSQNLISPQDQTRHIQFQGGFRPMSAPAMYGPKPKCHKTTDSDISQSDPHVNSIQSPHHQDVEQSGRGRSIPSVNYLDNSQIASQVENGKHYEAVGSASEEFHPHTSLQAPPQQNPDQSSEAPRSTEQTNRPSSTNSNSNEDKDSEHRHQPKLRVATAPIKPHLKQNSHPNAEQHGEEHFKKDLGQSPDVSPRYRELPDPQNEEEIGERKKSKKRKSKGRRSKRNGKKANKNAKKSRKHRSTRENMMAEAATYHWGMENHKDKNGFFLYANVPRDDAYEYGYRMGGPEQLVEKHHRTEGERSTIKLNWEDQNGDSGDQYWEFNHSASEGEDGEPKKRTRNNEVLNAD